MKTTIEELKRVLEFLKSVEKIFKEVEARRIDTEKWWDENGTHEEWQPPNLQKTYDGWFVVPQPPRVIHNKTNKQLYP